MKDNKKEEFKMERFENVVIRGIHATRYIMSYIRSGGEGQNRNKFGRWLKSLPLNLNDEEIYHIVYMYSNGKLELEMNAEKFLKNYKDPEEDLED